MTDKIVLGNFASFQNDNTAVALANANNVLITTAIDNTLSRDGTSPNQMGSTLDMNSNQIINLPAPKTINSPARLVDVITNPTVIIPPLPVSIANGGTGDIGTAWTTYTPTITSGTGTITTSSAIGRFKTLGKTVFIQISVTITTNGTGANFVQATLPINSSGVANYSVVGYNSTTAKLIAGLMPNTASTVIRMFQYDGTYPATSGDIINISGVYESI